MTRVIFIGATGTDIGKTYITSLLVRQLKTQGFRVRALKPIISGFDEKNIEESDSGRLLNAMNLDISLDNAKAISPWRYHDPIPPHMAASQSNSFIALDEVIQFCQDQIEKETDLDYLLIEGVGGIMVPLNTTETTLDWLERMNCSCLLVAGSMLGTLSHSLTALACINQRQIPVDGVIISESLDSYADLDYILQDFESLIPNLPVRIVSRHNDKSPLTDLVIP